MSQSNENMSETGSIIVAIIYLAIFILLIDHFSYVFVNAWYYFRVIQLTMLNFIPEWMPFSYLIPYDRGFEILLSKDLGDVDSNYINSFDSFFAPYLSWIPALFVYHLYRKLSDRCANVTTKYSMEEILRRNAKIFPFLKPYVDFNPATMEDLEFDRDDKRKLQYLPAINPVEFALMAPPLGLEKEAEKQASYRLAMWDGEDMLDEDLARRSFEKQLTNHYSSVEDSLTPSQRKIFDFLSPKAGLDRKYTRNLLDKYCKSIVDGKGIYSGDISGLSNVRKELIGRLEDLYRLIASAKNAEIANERFADPKRIKAILYNKKYEPIFARIHAENLMASHGFVVTGLMTLLEEGRGGGVIPCVEFIWLKGEDRPLWYALQSVGRKTSFSESGGAYAHWLLEKQVGKAITQPEVTSAVEALKLALYVDKKSLQRKKRQKEKMRF